LAGISAQYKKQTADRFFSVLREITDVGEPDAWIELRSWGDG
jgi:hypothetical protein